jgi:hypothetical protein
MHHSDSLAEAFRERMVPVGLVDSNTAISVLATPYDLPTRRRGCGTPPHPSRSSQRITQSNRMQKETSPSSHVLREIELPENTSLDESYSSCMAIAPTCTSSNNCGDNDQVFLARRIRLGGSPIPIDSPRRTNMSGHDARAWSPKYVGRFHAPHQTAPFENTNLVSTPRRHSSSTGVASPSLSVVYETESHNWTACSPSTTRPTIATASTTTTARSNFTMGVSFPSAWKRRLRYSRT